jgi:hypothetical protein
MTELKERAPMEEALSLQIGNEGNLSATKPNSL